MKNDLLVACQEGKFLQVVYEKSISERENCNALIDELVAMHNDGGIDVVVAFRALQNKADIGGDFFMIRHIFEKALPHLNSPIQPVMDCVLHLVNEAGQDLAAGTLFAPFIDFCAANPSRPKEALKQIEASIDQLANLLTPTIVAGTRIDIEYYTNEAIRLTGHDNIEIRKRAIFSLGKIQFSQNSNLYEPALACLETSLSKETDDQLLGSLIKSAFSLYKHDNSKLERAINLINCALSKKGDYALHAASELFGFDFNELPEVLLDALLDYLRCVKPQNKVTIDNIDYGLIKLLDQNPLKGIEFLESLLLTNPNNISFNAFDSVARKLFENHQNVLDRLMTRWFLRGDRILCECIQDIVNRSYNRNILLSVDPSELNSSDPSHIIFLARKAIGYLFLNPVTAASIITSLIQYTNDVETLQQLSDLLFDPLLINYPGKVSNYLSQQTENEAEKAKSAVEAALKESADYFDDLRSTGDIPELHPSQTQRDAHGRYFSRLISESLKRAGQESVFLSLVSKSVLLYGRKSINYAYSLDGESNRIEIPLSSHSTEMELPRHEYIDPFGLDYLLRIFRAEQIKV